MSATAPAAIPCHGASLTFVLADLGDRHGEPAVCRWAGSGYRHDRGSVCQCRGRTAAARLIGPRAPHAEPPRHAQPPRAKVAGRASSRTNPCRGRARATRGLRLPAWLARAPHAEPLRPEMDLSLIRPVSEFVSWLVRLTQIPVDINRRGHSRFPTRLHLFDTP